MRKGPILLAALWVLLACRRELPRPTYAAGTSLFPLETGRWWVYEVRETTYTTTGPESVRYLVRMRIDTPTTDAYRRPSFYVVWDTCAIQDSGQFAFYRVGLAYRDSAQAELWENNRRLLLLRFPLSPHLRWNRYQYTDLPPEMCRYLSTDTLYTLAGRTFPHSAFVLRQLDTISLLQRSYFYEVYAPNIGLVHRYERLDAYDLSSTGTLVRSTDSYHRELRLVAP